MRYKFIHYYKYAFTVELEDGRRVSNEEQESGEIYRLEISSSGNYEINERGEIIIDGTVFV